MDLGLAGAWLVTEFSGEVLGILRDGESIIRRGKRAGDGMRVLLQTFATESPPAAGVALMHHAVALRSELESSWAARPVEVVEFRGRPALVMEDPGGEWLDSLIGGPLAVPDFLRLAIGITKALGGLHGRGLVHKDVKPANLIVNAATGEAWLTGFGLTSRLPRHRQSPEPPAVIAGTLAYMAPEQTGRMNRSIDSRSDLYSLGVTLYEVLVGALPFTANDPMEWVHCHVARLPALPEAKEVPESIAAIILKLLAKAPEERYQTAAGLMADLQRCLEAWETDGSIAPFSLGASDVPDRLLIPEKLYGREKEVERLLSAFTRVVACGATELVLVSGYSGVGKSSVVNELHKALVPPRGLFASGKFDQYKRDIPYATVAQAFQSLVHQILVQSDADVRRWREALENALGQNGQFVVNLIPELELVIGKQPPVPDLPPQDAQQHFQMLLRRFLGVFAQPAHPLALFLDDLQWVDSASLQFIEQLFTESEGRHLLVIGAYRDHEVDDSHPLRRTMETIRQAAAPIHEIVLAPLGLDDVNRLVAEALRVSPEAARSLAQQVHEKTDGNPFFAIQFMGALADERLVSFDPLAGIWRWEMERIRATAHTGNVVELMVGKLNRLPAISQEILKSFACLGNTATTTSLAMVCGKSAREIEAALWEAAAAGLVLHLDGACKFAHDRVQEGAYALMPAEQRAAAHLAIGRVLAARTPASEIEEQIFEIVNHLNRGVALITDKEERIRLAEFNLVAGKRAKKSTAYASARTYLDAAGALLAGDLWEQNHPLIFDVELHRAECEFLTGDPAAAARLMELAPRARNRADAAAVACLRQILYTTFDRLDEAVEAGLEYLRGVGIEWTAHPVETEVQAEYERMWVQLESCTIEEMADLPLLTEPERSATMAVLTELVPAAFFTDMNLLRLVICRIANLSLEHGNTNGSSYAYSLLGFILGSHFDNYPAGFRFGNLALKLVERPELGRYKARVFHNFAYCINPWMRHLKTGRDLLRKAIDGAQETGDITFAAYTYFCLVTDLLATGGPLEEAQREAERGIAFATNARFSFVVDILTGHLRVIRALRGLTPSLASFDEPDFSEAEFERRLDSDSRLANPACVYWIRKLQARFHVGDYAAALVSADRAAALLWTLPSSFEIVEYHFYRALTHAARQDDALSADRALDLEALAGHGRKLAAWSENCPANFAPRAALVAAELARLEGRDLEAMRLYEQSMQLAREHGFVQIEALANELAARFCAARGLETSASAHRRNARRCYLRWGALGKVRQLDECYPDIEQENAHKPVPNDAMGQLDVGALMKMSRAITEEIALKRLIERLLVIAVEHAGAARGLFLLPHNGELRIEAEAIVRRDAVSVSRRHTPATSEELPEAVLRYVNRTHESVLLDDALRPNPFSSDDYIQRQRSRSVLCLPLLREGRVAGILYLENDLAPQVFTSPRMDMLQLLASQAAISLENSRLYLDLQHAGEKARLSERELRLALDTIPAIVSSSLPDGSNESFNQQWHAYTGINPEGSRNGGWLAAFHPNDVSKVTGIRKEMLAAGTEVELEARIRRFDGEYRSFLVRGVPLRDESGTITKWYGTSIDIDDLKRAEALLAGEKRLFEMIATGHSLPAILDALCRIVEELIGGALTSILLLDQDGECLRNGAAPNLPESFTRAVDGFLIGPAAGSCGTAAYRKEKVLVSDIATDPLWAECRAVPLAHGLRACWSTPMLAADGAVLGTIAMYSRQARQITRRENEIIDQFTHLASIAVERKLAEDALKKSEAFLAEGQRISHTGSWAWNLPSNHVIWSDEHCRMFGFRPGEGGNTFAASLERIHHEDQERARKRMVEAVQAGHDYSVEYRIVLPDGSVRFIQSVGRGIANESGQIAEYIGTSVDITERKRAEEELRRSESDLRKAQAELAHVTRVTTMGELAASIAHEVNQPIAGVVLNGNACLRWLSRLEGDSANLAEARGALQRIIRDGARAGEVIARIRALFKKTEAAREALELNQVIREVIVLARSEMDKRRVALRLELGSDLPRVLGDRVQLQQVILNLMLNSIEAMSAEEARTRELLIKTQLHTETEVLVAVTDSGIGLDPMGMEQMFTAFHTTKPGGLGMGLSISRSIVEAHHGRLWATANDGPGATFQFTLPRHAPENPAEERP